jgi:hypothetical protein
MNMWMRESSRKCSVPFVLSLRSFVVSDSGVTGVQVALSLFVLLGFAGLSFDLGRTLIAQTELQQAADGAALAAAAELDGFVAKPAPGPSDAITRATAAATAFVNNGQTFANTGSGLVTVSQIKFLSGTACGSSPCYPAPTPILPPSLPNDSLTTDPTDAAFVRIVTETDTITAALANLVLGQSTFKTNAVATAGRIPISCLDTPLLMCNPADQVTPGAPTSTFTRGQILTLVNLNPASGQIAAGDWGYACAPTDPTCGGSSLGTNLATASATGSQCVSDLLSTKPGKTLGPVDTNFNVRFGQNLPGPSGSQVAFDNMQYVPPPASGSTWTNQSSYWNTEHGTATLPMSGSGPGNSVIWFDVYTYENTIGGTAPQHSIPNSAYVSPSSIPAADVQTSGAREMNIGIVNCRAENLKGRWRGPAVGFLHVFILGPITDTTNNTINAEVLQQFNFSTPNGPIHNNVQLVR